MNDIMQREGKCNNSTKAMSINMIFMVNVGFIRGREV